MKRALALAACVTMLAFAAGLLFASPPPQTEEPVEAVPETVLRVQLPDGTVTQMAMTDYVTGVLLAELPGSFGPEMRKAQAVVSRTYAARRIGSTKHPSGADVCTDPGCCQGWMDPACADPENAAQNRLAAEETAGQVLIFDGKLIDATFFSCSGGRTEAAREVWGTDVPYLQPVDSPGEQAPHNEDTAVFTPEDFAEKLDVVLTGPPEDWIGTVRRTEGGGVAEMEICGKVFSGTELRKRLGLRSTNFEMTAEAGGIAIHSRGFGHRVGMSQYGAEAMAQAGYDYGQILAHYYTGAELVEWELTVDN